MSLIAQKVRFCLQDPALLEQQKCGRVFSEIKDVFQELPMLFVVLKNSQNSVIMPKMFTNPISEIAKTFSPQLLLICLSKIQSFG